MHRHLVLVRHAKSAWDDPSLADHDRPLASRGISALPRLRDHLARVPPPDLVLCSTSRRTLATLEGVRAALPHDVRIEIEPAIYATGATGLLRTLHHVDSDVGCVMVIGHNPGLQDLALLLAGSGDPSLRSRLATKLPTAAAVTLSLDGLWAGLGAGTSRLDDLFMPRPPQS